MFKNNILEISKRATKGGRVPIKIVLHKIHEDESETNKNGLHWKESYVKQAMDTAISMPICVEFADEDKSTPLGHGLTDQIVNVDGSTEPIFENSETVGVIESVSIESVTVNDEEILALVGNGYLFSQRYKKFVAYVRKNFALGQVLTSVEVMGLEENNNLIIYEEDDPTDEMRTCMEYQYSGVAILGIEPADDNAVVLEVAQKQSKEEQSNMALTEEMKSAIDSAIAATVTELNNKESESEKKISELNAQLGEKDTLIAQKDAELNEKEEKIVELNASVEQLQTALDQLKAEHDTYWAERELLEKELVKAKVEKKLGELNTALEVFSESEQEACKEEINTVKEDIENCEKSDDLENKTSEINSLVAKIYAEIGKASKQAEADQRASEQNSKKEKMDFEDIFSEICSDNDSNDDDDLNIF